MFSIRSSSSDREIRFRARARDEFEVELLGRSPCASLRVSSYTDEYGLLHLLRELAQQEKPWQGTKAWQSLEGEFSIEATCTSLGQVAFFVELRDLMGAPEEWEVSVGLQTEFGALTSLAEKAEAFFREH